MSQSPGATRTAVMVYDNLATFVRRDIGILETEFEVQTMPVSPSPKWRLPLVLLQQFFNVLKGRGNVAVYVHQSAGYLSFWPCFLSRVCGHKNIIIAIGTDSARLPEIGYGHFCKWPLRWFAAYSYRRAHLILPVHRSLERSSYTYTNVAYPQQGFRAFVPGLKTPVIEVVNGYDGGKWRVTQKLEDRPPAFLTVAVKLGVAAYYRKGIDMILDAARRQPELRFTLVTEFPDLGTIPENVSVLPPMPQEDLLDVYNAHQYYLQLSMFEGFPNALCEAMQCGCIPIGSDVAGIPDIIGECGYILKHKSAPELDVLLEQAQANGLPGTVRPEERIATTYPLERRQRELLQAINELLDA